MNLFNGEWRAIKGFKKYEITTNGQIRNAKTKRILNPVIVNDGFLQVFLRNDDKQTKTRQVHRLVAENFIDNPLGLKHVNHKDGNRANNNVNNLEWVMKSDMPTTRKGAEKTANKNKKPVRMLDLKGNVLAEFESLKQASEKTGIPSASISNVCRGVMKHSSYKKFEYIEEYK